MSPQSTVYRGKTGQWAFILHRITGFLVFFFLLLHVIDVSLINIDDRLYDEVHELYGNVLLRVFEVTLLAALLFHALNGIRIIMIDFFPGSIGNEKTMFTVVLFLSFVLTMVGGWIILRPFVEGTLLG